jgi:hypothetical protein
MADSICIEVGLSTASKEYPFPLLLWMEIWLQPEIKELQSKENFYNFITATILSLSRGKLLPQKPIITQ